MNFSKGLNVLSNLAAYRKNQAPTDADLPSGKSCPFPASGICRARETQWLQPLFLFLFLFLFLSSFSSSPLFSPSPLFPFFSLFCPFPLTLPLLFKTAQSHSFVEESFHLIELVHQTSRAALPRSSRRFTRSVQGRRHCGCWQETTPNLLSQFTEG